jgi:DNA replication and repair protein RecF
MVWVESVEITDLRNVERARMELGPGLNIFLGRNAQGKTTLLEAVGLLARGRSFRTEDVRSLIRRGQPLLRATAQTHAADTATTLEVEVSPEKRRLRVDGRDVPPRSYHGRLEVVVYATERVRVVRGPMRERRQFLDRGASSLWPVYHDCVRQYERVVQQRNAALEQGGHGQEAWDERLLDLGAELRWRRNEYVRRLREALQGAFRPAGEAYDVHTSPAVAGGPEEQRPVLRAEMEARRGQERRARRSLVGPHRDDVHLLVNGEDAARVASSGQCRSLLLALVLALLEVYHAERSRTAVALLDDLDSELDEERASALCQEVARRGQALVTTAHPAWAHRLAGLGRLFKVEAGTVKAA